MSIDHDAGRERRAALNSIPAEERGKAKDEGMHRPRNGFIDQRLTRRQVTNRVQRAAGEALAALQRRQRDETPSS